MSKAWIFYSCFLHSCKSRRHGFEFEISILTRQPYSMTQHLVRFRILFVRYSKSTAIFNNFGPKVTPTTYFRILSSTIYCGTAFGTFSYLSYPYLAYLVIFNVLRPKFSTYTSSTSCGSSSQSKRITLSTLRRI